MLLWVYRPLDFSAINLAQNATNLYWNLSRYDAGGCVEEALISLCGSMIKRRRVCSSSSSSAAAAAAAAAAEERNLKRGRASNNAANRDLKRQQEAARFYEFIAAEFYKRSLRLKQRKEQLKETVNEHKKTRIPSYLEGDDKSLIDAFIDRETGLIK